METKRKTKPNPFYNDFVDSDTIKVKKNGKNEKGNKNKEDKWNNKSFTPFRIENAQSASPSSRKAGDLNEKRCKKNISAIAKESPKGKSSNKWSRYKSIIKKNISAITREQHSVNVFQDQDHDFTKEINLSNAKIFVAKQTIYATFQQIAGENSSHKRWDCLKNEEDEIKVDEVLCSLCNQDSKDDDDILFCDKKGCFRAYHEKCLEPSQDDCEDDWFCRQCTCIDECLDAVNEMVVEGNACEEWQELFPEIRIQDTSATRFLFYHK